MRLLALTLSLLIILPTITWAKEKGINCVNFYVENDAQSADKISFTQTRSDRIYKYSQDKKNDDDMHNIVIPAGQMASYRICVEPNNWDAETGRLHFTVYSFEKAYDVKCKLDWQSDLGTPKEGTCQNTAGGPLQVKVYNAPPTFNFHVTYTLPQPTPPAAQ